MIEAEIASPSSTVAVASNSGQNDAVRDLLTLARQLINQGKPSLALQAVSFHLFLYPFSFVYWFFFVLLIFSISSFKHRFPDYFLCDFFYWKGCSWVFSISTSQKRGELYSFVCLILNVHPEGLCSWMLFQFIGRDVLIIDLFEAFLSTTLKYRWSC